MSKTWWYLRWHCASIMIHTAMWVAPRGKARDLLLAYLNGYGREIMEAIGLVHPKPNDHKE